MKLAVVGSRSILDKEFVFKTLDFLTQNLDKDESVVVVSGGAKGVDTLGALWAKERGYEVEIYLPDWDLHGKAAGFIRNSEIVDAATHLVAITTGSNGTANSIAKAKKKGIPTKVYNYDTKRV